MLKFFAFAGLSNFYIFWRSCDKAALRNCEKKFFFDGRGGAALSKFDFFLSSFKKLQKIFLKRNLTFKVKFSGRIFIFYQILKKLQDSYIIYIESEERENRIHAHGQEVPFLTSRGLAIKILTS